MEKLEGFPENNTVKFGLEIHHAPVFFSEEVGVYPSEQ